MAVNMQALSIRAALTPPIAPPIFHITSDRAAKTVELTATTVRTASFRPLESSPGAFRIGRYTTISMA